MFRFAYSLASKVRSVDIRPSKNSGLSLSRNYVSQVLQLGLQDKFSQDLTSIFPHLNGQESLLHGVTTSSLQQAPNPACHMDENGIRYLPLMREALRFGVLKALEDGVDYLKIVSPIFQAIGMVQEHLKCRVQMISTPEQFTQVSITAANGDTKTGQLVARAFEKVVTGLYILSDSLSNDVLEFYSAIALNWKPLSSFFLGGKYMRFLENPKILISENKIASENVALQAIGLANDKPLLIIAEGLGEEVMRLLVTLNRSQTKANVHVVKAPDVRNRKEIMQDLAIFTGGQVLSTVSDINFKSSMLGSCKKAVVDTNKKMVILGGSGSQEEIEKRCEQLRSTLDKDVEVDYSLKDRLDQLSQTAAVIKVDMSSEPKVGNIVDAVVSAYESGILPGAGVALLHASKELDKFQTKDSDGKIAIQIIQNALKLHV